MSSEPLSHSDIPFEKLRDPTREVTFWCNGEPVNDEIRISTLCQYCPNDECPGTFEASSDLACKTLKKWRQDRISLGEAIRAKRRHAERHEDTDEFRYWVRSMLDEELAVDDQHRDRAESELVAYAARVAKGQTAFGARNNCGPDNSPRIGEAILDPVTDALCERIERKRDELVDSEQFSTEAEPPVSEGETYEVDIIGTGKKGDGIAKLDGYVLVVPDASYGETVTVRIEAATPNVAFTRCIDTVQPRNSELEH